MLLDEITKPAILHRYFGKLSLKTAEKKCKIMENYGELWRIMDFLASFCLLMDLSSSAHSFSLLKMEATPNHREVKNPATEYLTIDQVKQCKGYEHITDQEALFIIQSITTLCQIAAKAATQSQGL